MEAALGRIGATILVVDDDADVRATFVDVLEDEGYRAIAAADGAEGLEQARREHPDLGLLDLRMPGVDGWEVLARLAAEPALAAIPVVIVSAVRGAAALAATCRPAAVLAKPCPLDELLGVIAALAGVPRPGRAVDAPP